MTRDDSVFKIDVAEGELSFKKLVLHPVNTKHLEVQLNSKKIDSKFKVEKSAIYIELTAKVKIGPSDTFIIWF